MSAILNSMFIFLYKLVNWIYTVLNLLYRHNFHSFIHHTRPRNTFNVQIQITNYENNTLIYGMMETVNKLNIYIFHSPNFNFFQAYINSISLKH